MNFAFFTLKHPSWTYGPSAGNSQVTFLEYFLIAVDSFQIVLLKRGTRINKQKHGCTNLRSADSLHIYGIDKQKHGCTNQGWHSRTKSGQAVI